MFSRSSSVRCSGRGFEPATHLIATHQTGLLEDRLAMMKNDEVRNALHAEAAGEIGMSFGVYFQDKRFAGHLLRDGLDFGSRGTARSAPGGPEIDQDGYRTCPDDFVEGGSVYIDRLGRRRQGRFTRAAAACVGQMLGRDSIGSSAVLTGSYGGVVHGARFLTFRYSGGASLSLKRGPGAKSITSARRSGSRSQRPQPIRPRCGRRGVRRCESK